MPLEIFETIEQGSKEWHTVRAGIPTASRFSDMMAEGKGISRKKYMRQLAGERITGVVEEGYKSKAMERGSAFEDEIRRTYALLNDCDPRRIGFAKNFNAGCSPDSLIGDDGGAEFKSAEQHVMVEIIERALADKVYFPSEHVAQVQGNLWVMERRWWDLVIYCPGLPTFIRRAQRDVQKIAEISAGVALFNRDVAALVDLIRGFK